MLDILKQVGFAPRACVWELTLACNLRCKHCGSFAGSRRDDELSLDENLAIADQLAALGCRRVTLSGGEPTLNPDWDRIGKRLADHCIKVNLISNGWHWNQDHVARAKAAGFCGAAFSLDGFEREHDEFRQPGSFVRVLAAIDACVEGGLPVAVNTTVNKLNARQLRQLRDFIAKRGVFSMQVQLATPSGNMGLHRELVLDPADLTWLVPELAAICRLNTRKFFAVAADDIGYYGIAEQGLRDDGGELVGVLRENAQEQSVGFLEAATLHGLASLGEQGGRVGGLLGQGRDGIDLAAEEIELGLGRRLGQEIEPSLLHRLIVEAEGIARAALQGVAVHGPRAAAAAEVAVAANSAEARERFLAGRAVVRERVRRVPDLGKRPDA